MQCPLAGGCHKHCPCQPLSFDNLSSIDGPAGGQEVQDTCFLQVVGEEDLGPDAVGSWAWQIDADQTFAGFQP
jgi:hypothetical protein